MRVLMLSFFILGVVISTGCATRESEEVAVVKSYPIHDKCPAMVELRVHGVGEKGLFGGAGQSVLSGNRFLTAAHVLPEYRKLLDSSVRVMTERQVEYRIHLAGVSGSDESFRQASETGTLSYGMVAADWAVGTLLTSELDTSRQSFAAFSGPLKSGMSVSLLRVSGDGRTVQQFDTRVVIPVDGERYPDNIVFMAKPSGFDHHGWSGCFVGRKQGRLGAWQLIGVLSASPTGENLETGERVELLVAVRPPPEVLDWFLNE